LARLVVTKTWIVGGNVVAMAATEDALWVTTVRTRILKPIDI
jgi:hypothetical protein